MQAPAGAGARWTARDLEVREARLGRGCVGARCAGPAASGWKQAGGGARASVADRPLGGCWDIHWDVMGTEEGLVKSRDMNPSSLSSLLSPVLPGMRTGGDDPAGGGRAEPRPEPSGQAFRRDAQTTRWCCGGSPTTRQVTILLSRRAKLLSLNTLGQRAHFLFPFRADARGVRQTQHPAVQLHLRVGPSRSDEATPGAAW